MKPGRRLLPVLVAGVVGASAAAQGALAAPPIVVADPARPSAIAFSDGSTNIVSDRNFNLMDVVCVAFVNHGPRTATKVGLNLAYVDASGTVLGVDFIYPSGKFLVDKRSAFSGVRGASPVSNGNCHPVFADRNVLHSTFTYRMGRGAPPTAVAAILVSAREIVYDDGTAWRSDALPQPADRVTLPPAPAFTAAVPNGPPLSTIRAVAGSPVEVNDAVSIGEVSRDQETCVTFTNHDARVAKRVNVQLALVDRTGTIVDVKTSYNTGTFSQAILIDNSRGACTQMYGNVDGDTFLYKMPTGEFIALGRIIAMPALVEFTDGTAWQAPVPFKPGDHITEP